MSDLKVKGKIETILEVEKGTSKAGAEWQKINFVINTGNEYNPLICFQIFGEDKVENFIKYNKVGQDVEVSFNVSSKEYKGRYYNSIDAWKVFKSDTTIAVEEPVEDTEDEMPF